MSTTSIKIPILARVEGEGALNLEIKDNRIEKLQLRIYESPRLFEKFLEGRGYEELLDLVARICGICPVAYQMSAAHAVESLFGVNPGPWVREMRRLFYCGEWLESHNLHIHFLAAPDFFGYSSALAMAKDYPEVIKRGMRLQGLGNSIMRLLGARSVHPVGACIGGFFRAPTYKEVVTLLNSLREGLQDAEALIRWAATLPLPKSASQQDFICVALQHPLEYPMNEGNITSDKGLNITAAEFEQYFQEYQVPYSTALQCTLQGKDYLVGPLARVNLNYHHLPENIKGIIKETGIHFPSKNMYHSIVARAIEVCYGIMEAIRILESYQLPAQSFIHVQPKAGIGFSCTEAPRGILWHRYEITEAGMIKSADIVSPTSQNQYRIEEDLRLSLEHDGLNRSDDILRLQSEMIIRNYDPCISCSTHFLDLRVNRL